MALSLFCRFLELFAFEGEDSIFAAPGYRVDETMGATMTFQIKRIYEPATRSDGARVLVDRLWPRGVRKSNAHIDHWMKDVAPSPRLRIWFGHRPERFAEFKKRYVKELTGNPELAELRRLGKGRLVTLLYGARDPDVNHAVVLASVLRKGARPSRIRKPSRIKKTGAKKKSA
jgi:uncharacterized protein YeaO (DUF488 family)